jgi:SAM-dependent methyltransferase
VSATTAPGNLEQFRAWDGGEGEHWTEHEDRYNAAAQRFDPHLFAAANVVTGERVLDFGCGCGLSTRQAAHLTPTGAVLGVDLSRRMIERARRRADEEGLDNVRFEQADAQTHRFQPDTYELAISRFGCMFFADPIAAFRNVCTALTPGGRLALLTWQPLEHNEWVHALRTALSVGRSLPRPPLTAPGPFGLSDPKHVRDVLDAGGFGDVAITSAEEQVSFGGDTSEALSFVRGLGLTRGLLHDLDDRSAQLALDRLHDLIKDHATTEGVAFSASAWVVTARKP